MAVSKFPTRWSNPSLLRAIKNPAPERYYRMRITTRELTFLGAPEQPDFARLRITYVADQHVIELKSLKKYLHAFRNRELSYERFISVVYNDLMQVYTPRRLRLTLWFHPRGGLSSDLLIDSAEQVHDKGGC